MKVTFLITSFNSKARYHPGIANLSAVLKQAGFKTDMLNVNRLDYSLIEDHIRATDPKIIAASTNTHQYPYIKQILEFIGGKYSHIKTICGGVHPTLDENTINDIKGLDAICKGDGEKPLLEYVRSIEQGGDRTDIPNIHFKRGSEIIRNAIDYFTEDLNELPFPDYKIFPAYENKDLHFPMRFLFNRGCPFNCTYCCNHILKQNYPPGKYVRYKKPQRVIDELLYFSAQYNFEQYVIDDDIFTLNKKWLLEFCDLYPGSLKSKKFAVNVRIGTVDNEILKALKNIGCHQAQLGLESGNDGIRGKVLGRKIKQEDIISTAGAIKANGIKLHTFNMIGVPGETRGNVMDTIRLNRTIKPDETQLTVFYPYPYTSLGEHCINNGLIKKSYADTYFMESILSRKARGISMFEIKHLVNFFKVYVFWGWNMGKVKNELRLIMKKSLPYRAVQKIKSLSIGQGETA
ncbi:MAG: B12-binding domain-containing radical SAM protein [Nitrospirota bacterium]|nr:B12-binding domain-containing radical SAM protein [Nitrospirota bacterium]